MVMKMTLFWNVMPYSLIHVYKYLRRTCSLHYHGGWTRCMWVKFFCNINTYPADDRVSHPRTVCFYSHCCENVRSCL